MIRVALVDDHVILRQALKALLEIRGVACVVAEASSAKEAERELADCPCDAVIMDISLPGEDGLACTRTLKARRPELPVLILSVFTDEAIVVSALRAGAGGYVVKSSTYEQLIEALRIVSSGGTYIHPQVAQALLGTLTAVTKPKPDLERPTQREAEVLTLIAHGLKNRDVADLLCISEVTVKSHLRSAYQKLGVTSRTQAVMRAIKDGVIQTPLHGFGQNQAMIG